MTIGYTKRPHLELCKKEPRKWATYNNTTANLAGKCLRNGNSQSKGTSIGKPVPVSLNDDSMEVQSRGTFNGKSAPVSLNDVSVDSMESLECSTPYRAHFSGSKKLSCFLLPKLLY